MTIEEIKNNPFFKKLKEADYPVIFSVKIDDNIYTYFDGKIADLAEMLAYQQTDLIKGFNNENS